jgi:hypothetical protein
MPTDPPDEALTTNMRRRLTIRWWRSGRVSKASALSAATDRLQPDRGRGTRPAGNILRPTDWAPSASVV